MANQALLDRLPDLPLARPGFDALTLSVPTMVQLNPAGKWENCKPESLDEEKLRGIVQHLIKTNALGAAKSYCCQCAAENGATGKSSYVPVIMMPIASADECPFDMNCEVKKIKETEAPKVKKTKRNEQEVSSHTDAAKKPKKRVFTMQRLTDFDLLSQW